MTVSARERGAALVLVLVFTTAMAAAAVAFLAGRRTDALTLRGQLQSVEADAMLSAALRETVVVLANRTPRQVIPAQLQWTLDDVAVLVQIERESGKIDLNKAPGSLLRALPMALGADEKRAAALAAAVQDWRDDNHDSRDGGAEDRDYRSGASAAHGAADRPMANPAELLYLQGIDRAAWVALQPYVTVYSGAAGPDAKAAPPLVRRAMQIARGLARDDEPEDRAKSEESGQSTETGQGVGDSMGSTSRAETGTSTTSSGAETARSRFSSRSDRDETGTQTADSQADAGTGTGEGGDGGGEGALTLLLDVRFPNGYEAAAKAVIALTGAGDNLSGAGDKKPPYTVLSWTPILRSRGEGS